MLAFVRGTLNRPTWNSLWADARQGLTFGTVIPSEERFSAGECRRSPSQLRCRGRSFISPSCALFLFIYTRRLDWRKPLNTVAFAGLTINLFLLWSKGLSGQFLRLRHSLCGAVAAQLARCRLLDVAGRAVDCRYSLVDADVCSPQWPKPNWFTTWIIIARTTIWVVLVSGVYRIDVPASRLRGPVQRTGRDRADGSLDQRRAGR